MASVVNPVPLPEAARALPALAFGGAAYGFAVGSVHSPAFAARNLVKFPLLLLLTAAICALAYFVFARFITRRLSFGEVQALSLRTFGDLALLLASLAPVNYFLARTILQPDGGSLREYPFFLGLNVGFIALAGSTALVRRGRALLHRQGLSPRAAVLVLLAWLALSLFAGGQCAWFLRPFFGVSTIRAEETPFIMGRRPDYRGATSFYHAVYHVLFPPPLSKSYFREDGGRPAR